MSEDKAPAGGYSGSGWKGFGCSLAAQFLVFMTGAVLYGQERVGRRQFLGEMTMLLWGLAQWAIVLPLARWWKRKGETRTARALRITSLVCSIPSFLLFFPTAGVEIAMRIEERFFQ